MTYLSGKEFDCAFVVLDPRQEEAGEWGMDYFLKTARSRYMFPDALLEQLPYDPGL